MNSQLVEKLTPQPEEEQIFVLRNLTWQQFKAIQKSFNNVPGVRLSYLDGTIEFMPIREPHEVVSTILGILLALYFAEIGINIYGTGSVTLESVQKNASVEPDLSYYIDGTEGKKYPDLAIEVVYTSGGKNKLDKYKRLKIQEVWFWQKENISIYRLRGEEYEQISPSEFFPNLDISLLVKCSLIHLRDKNMTKAMSEFLKSFSA